MSFVVVATSSLPSGNGARSRPYSFIRAPAGASSTRPSPPNPRSSSPWRPNRANPIAAPERRLGVDPRHDAPVGHFDQVIDVAEIE